MADLIPFHTIDPYDDDTPSDVAEAAEFLQKLDHEGGVSGMLGYGGADVFPEELSSLAEEANRALTFLNDAVNTWAAERGVSY